MCSSLADGGLRCPSHIKKDLEALKLADNTGLKNAAKDAGVPIDQEWVETKVTEHVENYTREAELNEEMAEKKREELLAIHQLTMEAKNALNDPTIRDTDDFISPFHDFVAVTESLKEKLARDGDKDLSKEQALSELQNRPEFNSFDRMEEFADTTNLSAYQDSRIKGLKEKLRLQTLNLDQERLDQLHRNNPMLKKLRKKAAIANFISPMGDGTYTKEKAYEAALIEEKSRTGFTRSSQADFPETVQALHKAEVYGQQIDAKRRELNQAYESHTDNLLRQGEGVKYRYAHNAEGLILKAPESGTYRQLAYKDRLRTFNKKKEEYTALASKEYDVDNAATRFRSEVTAKAPFDNAKLKEFKTEVYNKSPEGKQIDAELREKRAQLYMTPQYRKELETQASRAAASGDIEKSTKLMARKRKLDSQAETTMGQNRLKAMSLTGVVPQGTKNVMRAQREAAPAHYRTNLANAK